jgi:hypothetical protein
LLQLALSLFQALQGDGGKFHSLLIGRILQVSRKNRNAGAFAVRPL